MSDQIHFGDQRLSSGASDCYYQAHVAVVTELPLDASGAKARDAAPPNDAENTVQELVKKIGVTILVADRS